jgi:hypothetical protein
MTAIPISLTLDSSALPPGPVGPQGPQGNPGPQGPAGVISPITQRVDHQYAPVYDLASGVLSVQHHLQTGAITIPEGKQYNVMRFEGTVTGGVKFKGINWEYHVTNPIDAYCAIGLLRNYGSGNTKALYGRSEAMPGCTGVVVGVVAGTTVNDGAAPSDVIGLEVSMDGAAPAQSSAVRIDTSETAKTVKHGILSLLQLQYSDSFIKAFNSGAGSFLKWQEPDGTALFEVDKSGGITKRDSAGNVLFRVDAAGNLRVAFGGVLKDVVEGPADSGGTGYRVLRVQN